MTENKNFDWLAHYLGVEPNNALRKKIIAEMVAKSCTLEEACRPYSQSLTAIEHEGKFSINGELLTKAEIDEKYGHRQIIFIH